MKNEIITGTICINDEVVTFVCENFRFTFVRSDYY